MAASSHFRRSRVPKSETGRPIGEYAIEEIRGAHEAFGDAGCKG